jgi:hypothetical protein
MFGELYAKLIVLSAIKCNFGNLSDEMSAKIVGCNDIIELIT